MPRFRAFDFLSEAQRKSQVFLSYFLVAVPFHLETVDQYAHNGSVGNDSFRKPWLYEDGGIFVDDLEDYGLPSKEAISKDIIHDERPYKESSCTQWTVERFSIEDDIMVIPSSNPESPQITNEERFQLQSSLLSSMSESDTLSDDENILALQACSWTCNQCEEKDFFLEVPEACFNSFAEPVPCIKELCLHLKKKQVKDPFLDSRGNPVCQSHFFR
ncbi:hypothetical protein HOLleu_15280 [Holothuria leucospilota]|uniref:Uncharacterized protein n=1 Tax=Holothuria leucospilota TaxID=206669 RepID=A0A9Q1HD27_HOLLE|nr:hypothetical protein HOLleu_15280 [Holothuria leucospilota]